VLKFSVRILDWRLIVPITEVFIDDPATSAAESKHFYASACLRLLVKEAYSNSPVPSMHRVSDDRCNGLAIDFLVPFLLFCQCLLHKIMVYSQFCYFRCYFMSVTSPYFFPTYYLEV